MLRPDSRMLRPDSCMLRPDSRILCPDSRMRCPNYHMRRPVGLGSAERWLVEGTQFARMQVFTLGPQQIDGTNPDL